MQIYQKRGSGTGGLLWILLKVLKNTFFFVEDLWWLLLYSYIAFLPSRAFFPFEMIYFIRNTLTEEAKFISIKYFFQNISLNIYKYLFQELVVSSVTDLHSPPITLSEVLCLKKIEFASCITELQKPFKEFYHPIFCTQSREVFFKCNTTINNQMLECFLRTFAKVFESLVFWVIIDLNENGFK